MWLVRWTMENEVGLIRFRCHLIWSGKEQEQDTSRLQNPYYMRESAGRSDQIYMGTDICLRWNVTAVSSWTLRNVRINFSGNHIFVHLGHCSSRSPSTVLVNKNTSYSQNICWDLLACVITIHFFCRSATPRLVRFRWCISVILSCCFVAQCRPFSLTDGCTSRYDLSFRILILVSPVNPRCQPAPRSQ